MIQEGRAQAAANRRIARAWLAPQAFRRARAETVTGVYVPTYLYSAHCESDFKVEIGEQYQESETYTTTENGRSVQRTRTVTSTEWYPLRGRYSAYVERVVSASSGIPNPELEAIEPFDLRALHRFRAETLAGFAAEEASLPTATCWANAREEASAEVGERISKFLPGDSQRSLEQRVDFRNEDLTLALLPVWVLAVRYHPERRVVRMLINGQTGALYVRTPISKYKVLTLAMVVIGLCFLALWKSGVFE
ncbi:MAG: hypothetical protein SFV15_21995 [Polyangiaceae bacterium]|nr:hypothetical protein [Polyangiaceae bacterium]